MEIQSPMSHHATGRCDKNHFFVDNIVHFRSRWKENRSKIPVLGIYWNVKLFLQPIKLREISIIIRSSNYKINGSTVNSFTCIPLSILFKAVFCLKIHIQAHHIPDFHFLLGFLVCNNSRKQGKNNLPSDLILLDPVKSSDLRRNIAIRQVSHHDMMDTNWASSWDYGTSEGSGEPAQLRSLARAFTVHTHKVWKKTKCPTKNQTSSPTGWLCMRVWRMSLRRTKSAIIWWAGSINNPSQLRETKKIHRQKFAPTGHCQA